MDLTHRFTQLDDFLTRHQALWRDSPFCFPQLQWQSELPELSAALLALDDDAVAVLDQDDAKLVEFLTLYLPIVNAIRDAVQLPAWPDVIDALPERLAPDVPGRKWRQVNHFIAGLTRENQTWLDWCAGKSHLGRAILLRHRGAKLFAVERDNALCEQGAQAAAKQKLDIEFICADVLRDTPSLPRIDQACALHACGDLHIELIRQVVANNIPALSLAPCCYHLTAESIYQPLSQCAQRSTLRLSRSELHLAVEETITSSPRIQKQRDTLMQWRLAFDGWQRQRRGVDQYLVMPSRPYSVIAKGFECFVDEMCQHHQLPPPSPIDHAQWQQYGQQRWRAVQRLQLLRHAFRRALELWLVCDRALWLAEHDYQVGLYQFCPRQLTPRNMLIEARKTRTVYGN